MTAAALIAEVRARGGRVHRTVGGTVFAVTDSRELANRLALLGAHVEPYTRDSHTRKTEWDCGLGRCVLEDPENLYAAAGA